MIHWINLIYDTRRILTDENGLNDGEDIMLAVLLAYYLTP